MNRDKHIISLIHRLAKHDAEAFNEIYILNYNRLLRYGIVINRDSELVADVIQDLFVWIWQHADQLKKIENFQVYLFKSFKRNLLRRLSSEAKFIRDTPYTNHLTSDSNIEIDIIKEETDGHTQRWLTHQLDRLPSKQREVIFLRYYEGHSYDEIAEILSTNNQVVRNYSSRALNNLRRSVDSQTESD